MPGPLYGLHVDLDPICREFLIDFNYYLVSTVDTRYHSLGPCSMWALFMLFKIFECLFNQIRVSCLSDFHQASFTVLFPTRLFFMVKLQC